MQNKQNRKVVNNMNNIEHIQTVRDVLDEMVARQKKLAILGDVRSKQVAALAETDAKIAALVSVIGTSKSEASKPRAASTVRTPRASLTETLEAILGKSKTPLKVNDIVDGLRKAGVRSRSAHASARNLLYTGKRFAKSGKGLFTLASRVTAPVTPAATPPAPAAATTTSEAPKTDATATPALADAKAA